MRAAQPVMMSVPTMALASPYPLVAVKSCGIDFVKKSQLRAAAPRTTTSQTIRPMTAMPIAAPIQERPLMTKSGGLAPDG